MNKKKLFSYLILTMMVLSFLPLLSNTVGAADPYSAWSYYKSVSISNAENDYVMFLNVTYDADMSSTTFEDMRFANYDNDTGLDYFISYVKASEYAHVYVELPSDIETDNMIIMSYGNAVANNASNGDNTFWFFDHFTTNNTFTWVSHNALDATVSATVDDHAMISNYRYAFAYSMGEDWNHETDVHDYISVNTDDDNCSGGADGRPDEGIYTGFSIDDNRALKTNNTIGLYVGGMIGGAFQDGAWVPFLDYRDEITTPPAGDKGLSYNLVEVGVNASRAINWSFYTEQDRTVLTQGYNTGVNAHPNVDARDLCISLEGTSSPATDRSFNVTNSVGVFYLDDDGKNHICFDWIFVDEYVETPPTGTFGGEGAKGGGGAGYSCSVTDDEEGDWEFSECVTNGTMDEEWWADDYNDWVITDRSAEWSENRSYSHWDATGTAGMNTTFINSSGMNRSQLIVNIHHNGSLPLYYTNSSAGYVYQDCDGNALYLLKAQGQGTYMLYYNESTDSYWDLYTHGEINITNASDENLTNWGTLTSGVYNNSGEAANYYWETAPHGANGSWLKALVNAECENISFKAWGDPTMMGLMQEPAGWAIHHQDEDWTLFNCTYLCQGLAIWNPEGEKVRWDFDIFNVFQENFTLNTSRVTDFYPDGTPYWQFPIVDGTVYYENLYAFFNETTSGNASAEDIIPLLRNITNATEVNSRPYTPDDGVVDNDPWEQYDYNRIYTSVITNGTDFGLAFDNILWVYIHACSYGYGPASTGNGQVFVAIDVDGNDSWDTNDRAYYTDTAGNDWEWHGSAPAVWSIAGNAWFTGRNAYQNIHRYNHHLHGSFFIPLAHLIKNDGTPLNVSDVFNITAFCYQAFDNNICFLHNYNESACTPLMTDDHDTVKPFFLNETTLEQSGTLDINGTNIGRWAQGEIVGGLLDEEYDYNWTVEKTVNRTVVGETTTWSLLNYSVYINNTGTGPLTNIYVNETWHECGCSPWNWSIDSISVANSTYDDWHNDSCYWIIYNASLTLNASENWHIWYVMNITNCTDSNLSGYLYNNITVNCTEIGTDATDSVSTVFGVQASSVRITGRIPYPDIIGTGNTVFTLIGVLLLIGSILLIVFIAKKNNLF